MTNSRAEWCELPNRHTERPGLLAWWRGPAGGRIRHGSLSACRACRETAVATNVRLREKGAIVVSAATKSASREFRYRQSGWRKGLPLPGASAKSSQSSNEAFIHGSLAMRINGYRISHLEIFDSKA